jgi:hypothetical protein
MLQQVFGGVAQVPWPWAAAQHCPGGQSCVVRQPTVDASTPERLQRPWSQAHMTCASSGQLDWHPRVQGGGLTAQAIWAGSHVPQPHQ